MGEAMRQNRNRGVAVGAGIAIVVLGTIALAAVATPAAAGPLYTWYEDDYKHKCWEDEAVSGTLVKKWPKGEAPDYNSNGVVCFYWARAV